MTRNNRGRVLSLIPDPQKLTQQVWGCSSVRAGIACPVCLACVFKLCCTSDNNKAKLVSESASYDVYQQIINKASN